MSVVLDSLREQELDRAHVVTAFFWAGLGSGYRMRRYFESVKPRMQDTAAALRASLGVNREDPFCAGWDFGWEMGVNGEHES